MAELPLASEARLSEGIDTAPAAEDGGRFITNPARGGGGGGGGTGALPPRHNGEQNEGSWYKGEREIEGKDHIFMGIEIENPNPNKGKEMDIGGGLNVKRGITRKEAEEGVRCSAPRARSNSLNHPQLFLNLFFYTLFSLFVFVRLSFSAPAETGSDNLILGMFLDWYL